MIVSLSDTRIEDRVEGLKEALSNIDDPLVEKDQLLRICIVHRDRHIQSDIDRYEPYNVILGQFRYGHNSYREAEIRYYDGLQNSDLVLDYAILNTWTSENRARFDAFEALNKLIKE